MHKGIDFNEEWCIKCWIQWGIMHKGLISMGNKRCSFCVDKICSWIKGWFQWACSTGKPLHNIINDQYVQWNFIRFCYKISENTLIFKIKMTRKLCWIKNYKQKLFRLMFTIYWIEKYILMWKIRLVYLEKFWMCIDTSNTAPYHTLIVYYIVYRYIRHTTSWSFIISECRKVLCYFDYVGLSQTWKKKYASCPRDKIFWPHPLSKKISHRFFDHSHSQPPLPHPPYW